MSATYEFKCTPPNEASRVVRIDAASYDEAFRRASVLWCRQMHPPILLCRIARERQTPLIVWEG